SRGPCQLSLRPKSDAIQLTMAFSRNMIVASGTATVGTTALTISGELHMSTISVHPNLLAVSELLATVEHAADGGKPHFARDNRAVREHAASLDDQAFDPQEKRRPSRIGGLGDQNRVLRPVGGQHVVRISNDADFAADQARRERLTVKQPGL